MEFYSNCFIEAIRAKIRNPKVRLMYLPAFLNDAPCPHWMWADDDGEHDFHYRGYLHWWQWIWHKGTIRTVRSGNYKRCISRMVSRKYYTGSEEEEEV